MTESPRVRIAPSPTGHLHVGTARTALYNYLFAHHHKGTFVLRLEDTDEQRSDEAYTKDIIDGLRWLGLHWDEGPDVGGPYAPYRQTEKVDRYNHIANQLIAQGLAYFCYCTQEELSEQKDQQKSAGKAARYDNRCRHLTSQRIEQFDSQGRVPSIRFKLEEPRVVSWHDAIKGEIAIDSSDLGGDMVIVKSNGIAIYNFAVVIDDLDMKITHVIRGEDHIHNTAKQILLYEALGKTLPHFAHVALIFDAERRKLSKRQHGEAVHISRYRADGYMPEALVNYLAQMSWTPPDGRESFTLDEAAQMFDLSRVSKSPAIFDIARLNWYNSNYIRKLPLSTITDRAMPFLPEQSIKDMHRFDVEEIVGCVRDGLTVLSELPDAISFFLESSVDIEPEIQDTLLSRQSSQKVLCAFLQTLPTLPWGDHVKCKAAVDAIGQELGLKGKDLYWPIRAALSGKTQGPDLGSIISILGESKVRQRVESTLKLCHHL
ncbi:MAG: glutamate--tRNA ligase [Candidatus Melainabacteria bacterium]|nr:glutamate--tRNA ligase [Candidatus Melainabacteria bacterium]